MACAGINLAAVRGDNGALLLALALDAAPTLFAFVCGWFAVFY
jgi:hypothetical protein